MIKKVVVLSWALGSGVSFAAEIQTPFCPMGQHWVRTHYRKAYTRFDGVFVSASNVSAHCADNPPGYSRWSDRFKVGRPQDWKQSKEKSGKWTTEEEERVLDALSALPSTLLTESVRGIYRMKKSDLYETNPAAGQWHEIALYDPAFGSKQNLSRVMAHEFSHELWRQLPDSQKFEYLKAADWLTVKNEKTGEYLLVPNRDGYVEEDGKEGPDEDFSNNIEYFLFNRDELRSKSPKAHDWLLKRFGDNFKLRKGL